MRIPLVRFLITMVATVVAAAACATFVTAAPPVFGGGPRVVKWMIPAKMTAAVPSGQERERTFVEARQCGRTAFERDFLVYSGPGGRWERDFYPMITTAYRLRWNDELSETITLQVRPSVVLRESFPKGRFVVTVTALREFRGLRGVIERRDRRTGRWALMKRFRFTESGLSGQTRFTKGYVRVKVPRGTLVRAVLPLTSARPCYLAGYSNFFTTT